MREVGGADSDETRPVSVPARFREVRLLGGKRLLGAGLGVDGAELVPLAALRDERDEAAVGRPGRLAIVRRGGTGERAHRAGLDVDHADLGAIEVGPWVKRENDAATVVRDRGCPLVAANVESR